jgi:hypothetical protein
LTFASIVVMPMLARAKRRAAATLASGAAGARADSGETRLTFRAETSTLWLHVLSRPPNVLDVFNEHVVQ